MKRNRQIIRRKCSLKGRLRQKRISFWCFQFCYTIHQSRMQSSPFQKPILSGSQSTIYAFGIETESLSDRSCTICTTSVMTSCLVSGNPKS